MKMHHPDNNKKELTFTDHTFHGSLEELRDVIMTILRNGGCEYESKYLLPEVEFYHLTLNGTRFYIMTDNFDRTGCVIITNEEETMVLIEKIFTDAGIEWYTSD